MSLPVKRRQLRRVRILAGGVARSHALAQNGKVHIVALRDQTRRRGSTTQNFIVGMSRHHQYLHFALPFLPLSPLDFSVRVILTSATTRPSYKAGRLNSKRKPACSRKARGYPSASSIRMKSYNFSRDAGSDADFPTSLSSGFLRLNFTTFPFCFTGIGSRRMIRW